MVISGWVPELLLANPRQPHTGSLDVDLALDHNMLSEAGYKTILQLLLSRGYRRGEQPFIFFRTVQIGENTYAPFLVMKGIAIAARLREKDARDIYYCIRNYGNTLHYQERGICIF